jgi:hypothetical protein
VWQPGGPDERQCALQFVASGHDIADTAKDPRKETLIGQRKRSCSLERLGWNRVAEVGAVDCAPVGCGLWVVVVVVACGLRVVACFRVEGTSCLRHQALGEATSFNSPLSSAYVPLSKTPPNSTKLPY